MSLSEESRSELVLELAEEFLERYRKGERPPLKEYIDRHPELAAEIKEVFPAMAMMENIAVADESVEGGQTSEVSKTSEVSLRQLGDYRLIREIGHGGMGVVYEAEQVSLGRHVALKVLLNQALLDAKQKRRFEREAKAAAKLHHTNIVPVFGVGEHDGLPYYVMQFIQGLGLDAVLDELNRMQPGATRTPSGLPTAGEIRVLRRDITAADIAHSLLTKCQPDSEEDWREASAGAEPSRPSSRASHPSLSDSFTVSSLSPRPSSLASRPSSKKPTYWQSVADIGRQVADALEYAHRQGVLHRDVKPSNLLLDMRGTVWVTDFGLAKVAGPGAGDGENITHTGDILGTLRYMPPEAFEGKSDARSDVYSLGITLYELLALRPAFAEKERNKLIKRVTTGEPPALDKVSAETPRDLVTIIHKAIDREPGRRYATAEDFAADLQRFLDDEPILARRQTQRERYVRWARHNPGMAVLGGVLTAVLVLVTLGSLVVASHMSSLAENEAQAAADERAARQEADGAKDREARERTQAVQAKKDADRNRKRAEEALKQAEENFAKARAAVNDYLTAVSEDDRLKAPGLQGLRVHLLQSALQFYQEFLKERGTDPTLRRELAGVYYKVGEIYRDLRQSAASNQAYAQARRLYESLTAESPNDLALQHGLAMTLYRSGSRAQAITILEKLIRPDDPRYHADLGYAYNDAALDVKDNKLTELEFLRKSLVVRERLVRLKSDDPDARLGLSASLNNIAIRLQAERNGEALALLRRALEQSETAYRLRPADELTVRFMTTQLQNIADRARLVGATDAEIGALRRRVEVFDRQARDYPAPGFDMRLCKAYDGLLYALWGAGRLDEAARLAERGHDRLAETTEEATDFLRTVSEFRLTAHEIARARVRTAPDKGVTTEKEAAAVVDSLRQHALAGWSDANWMRTDARTEFLRQRADFKELLARMDELDPANATTQSAAATPEEKLAARKKILTALEALAGPLPPARFVRRGLAQARQNLAQALLDTGRVENARLAFDEAIAARQKLLEEAPSSEQLWADLAQSQSAGGDLFAAAGKLSDAVKTWEKALATLEGGLKTNPNSIPFQTALTERLLHVADQYGRVGLWDSAAKHYRRAFNVQAPINLNQWRFFALVMLETGDAIGHRSLVSEAVTRLAAAEGFDLLYLGQFTLLVSDGGSRYPAALKRVAQGVAYQGRDWHAWCRGLAAVRLGQAERGLPLLEQVKDPLQKLPALALALHRLGQTAAAEDALHQADQIADQRMREGLSQESVKVPDEWWPDWLQFRILRREAHQVIHGKPMPESPYDRLFRGRVLSALGQGDKAEAEFAAAVALRPDDAEVWLTRSRIYAKLGHNDRMAADLLHAQRLKADAPRPWVETGRLLAERGEHKQADAAFARAAVLARGELSHFLEAGWWTVGPYPEEFDLACPPELDADPSRPVAAVGEKRELKWQTVPSRARNGEIRFGNIKDGSMYSLAYVHADRDRTASLVLRSGDDIRLWVNGKLTFDSLGAWGLYGYANTWVAVSLRAGRNTLLLKTRHVSDNFFECQFHDAPPRRAHALMIQGLWAQAADAFAEAERREPLEPWRIMHRIRCLLAAGRGDEADRVFAQVHLRLEQREFSARVVHMVMACYQPPKKDPERDRWVTLMQRVANNDFGYRLTPAEQLYWLAHACLRAGRLGEAERHIRHAIQLADQLKFHPLLASILHYRGRADEGRKVLQAVEARHAQTVVAALAADRIPRIEDWDGEPVYLASRREARILIHGKDAGPSANETVLQARAHEQFMQQQKVEDQFETLVTEYPKQPRLLIDLGRRLGELGRWDEATKAFVDATELAPKSRQVWNERGRAYAVAGKWDEAAADFAKALALASGAKSAWFSGSARISGEAVRLEELFTHVAKLRPADRQLWIERVHFLARNARWPEAAKAIARVLELDPEDHLTWHLQAALQLQVGDLDGYRRDCRAMRARFGKTKDGTEAVRIASACLLAPQGTEDVSSLLTLLEAVPIAYKFMFWNGVTLGRGHYRQGHFAQAAEVLARVPRNNDFTTTAALAFLAMCQQKQNQPDAARQSLQQARDTMARLARPGPGAVQDNWYDWVQCQVILREAEALIPDAPVVAGTPGSTSQDYAAQRERKARAERISTQAALAQLRFDAGQHEEAETELRALLGERTQIAAEEPANPDYQVDLVATHFRLAQFLADSGRPGDAFKEAAEALAFLEKLSAQNPKNPRFRTEAASGAQEIGDMHAKADQPTHAVKAWKKAIEILNSALKENPENRAAGAALAMVEEKLANYYGALTLWSETAELLARAVRRPGGGTDAWRWLRAGQAMLASGNVTAVRKLATEAFERFRTSADSYQLIALVELMALTDSSKETLSHMIRLAEQSAREQPKQWYLATLVGIYELRSGTRARCSSRPARSIAIRNSAERSRAYGLRPKTAWWHESR